MVGLDRPGTSPFGPAQRTWNLATHLAGVDVTLALPATAARPPHASSLRLLPYAQGGEALRSALASHDMVLIHTLALHDFPFLAGAGLPLVVDLGVPFGLELLEAPQAPPSDARRREFSEELRILNELLRAGDFFLCGEEARRGFWLGMLCANHRVNPHTLAQGADLRHLLDVVPDAIEGDDPRTGPLAAFCARPRRAPDQGLYVTPVEQVAQARAETIESLLEFNYWHRSSVERGGAIEYLAGQVRQLQAELERYRQGGEAQPREPSLRALLFRRIQQRLERLGGRFR